MADWRVVTPTREPEDDEINTPSGFAPGVGNILLSPGNFAILCTNSDPRLAFKIQNVQPVVTYYYDFTEKTWLDSSFEPIDITTVDLVIPEAAITGATVKTSYFNLIAYEKGTTACKLAVANEAKTLIRNALINKGVDVPDTTPFRQYAGKVGEIAALTPLTLQVSWDPYNTQAARVEYLGSDGAYHISYLAQPEYPNPPDRFEAQIAAGSIIYVNLGGSPASPNPSSSMTLLMSDVGNTEYVYRVGGPSVTSAYLELFA